VLQVRRRVERGPASDIPALVSWIDYLMKGFVPYQLSAERTGEGSRLAVRKTGTNRDESVDWFVEKYLTSKGLTVTKSLA
jgi:hypothetical protein